MDILIQCMVWVYFFRIKINRIWLKNIIKWERKRGILVQKIIWIYFTKIKINWMKSGRVDLEVKVEKAEKVGNGGYRK
jgi:hypothetical protein